MSKGQIKEEKNFNTLNSSQYLNNQNFTLFQNKFTVEKKIFTLAYSIFSVQHPAYISAPLRAALAFWAHRTDSNISSIKEIWFKVSKIYHYSLPKKWTKKSQK